ncbi:putative Pentatricopeptide repeat-containing protein [Cocos nucifera]|uniref:Putative Pentatricopeptide repeat-containing protein n=1 Tax=Cocos nucifera TaxID=13894 RepID=A0A8K0I1V6_COCNU|nr:putative Pentatricopeptide repeat-containing protein [Cocos nucifera]
MACFHSWQCRAFSQASKGIGTITFNPSASMGGALLGACKIQGNIEIEQRIATRLLEMELLDSSVYILLSNIYPAANRWDDVAGEQLYKKGYWL